MLFADATAEDWAPLPSEFCHTIEVLQTSKPEEEGNHE